jgi:hypothetical protein
MILSPPELLDQHPQVLVQVCENINIFFVKLDVQVSACRKRDPYIEIFSTLITSKGVFAHLILSYLAGQDLGGVGFCSEYSWDVMG